MKQKDISMAVALYPHLNDDMSWDGTMTVMLEEANMDKLDAYTAQQVEMFAGMTAACVELMQTDNELLLRAQQLYLDRLDAETKAEEEQVKEAIKNSKGKVVSLNANTKTMGNA